MAIIRNPLPVTAAQQAIAELAEAMHPPKGENPFPNGFWKDGPLPRIRASWAKGPEGPATPNAVRAAKPKGPTVRQSHIKHTKARFSRA